MYNIDRKKALKIKAKHLAAESKIIRFEELKTIGETRDWLHNHRILTVRPEARATHLAYAFSKGTPLNKVEKYPDEIPREIWKRTDSMVAKYADTSNYADWKMAR